MKIYLASFLESENHGPGRKIAVANPGDKKVAGVLKYFMPSENILEAYKTLQGSDQKLAAEFFISSYRDQLEKFVNELQKAAKEENTTMIEQLPIQEGDTLLSWERYAYTNYRGILADYLLDIGYEVVSK